MSDSVAPAVPAAPQATMCACCGEHKPTPLRVDRLGGYVCLSCIGTALAATPEPRSAALESQAVAVPRGLVIEVTLLIGELSKSLDDDDPIWSDLKTTASRFCGLLVRSE